MIKIKRFQLKKNDYLVIYKLLHDALFLALCSFSVMLLAEGMIPGFVSAHLSFAKVAITITAIILSIAWLGDKLQISYDAPKIKGDRFIPFFVLTSFLLIGNSMLRFDLWANIIISLLLLFVLFLIFEMFESN